jgi:hypothetical protein
MTHKYFKYIAVRGIGMKIPAWPLLQVTEKQREFNLEMHTASVD